MCNGFLHTHSRPLLVIERAQGEGERAGFLLDLGEHSSGSFHFQLIVDIV